MTAQEVEAPAAGDRRGTPGHDQATDRMVGAMLIRDRAAGMTYAQLAQAHGYADPSGARNALLRALDRHEADNAAELRTFENLAYLADQRVLRTIISDPNQTAQTRIRAVDARTRSAARHSRLNGLDAPLQVQISAGVAAELEDALAELSEVAFGEVISITDLPPDDTPTDDPDGVPSDL